MEIVMADEKHECIFVDFDLSDSESQIEQPTEEDINALLPYHYRLKDGRYPADCIYENIDGAKITFESNLGQYLVAKALSYIPAEIVASLIDKVAIVFAEKEGVAGTALPRQFTDGKEIIHINLCLAYFDPKMEIRGITKVTDFEHKVIYLIAHEVAHFHLGHASKLFDYHGNTWELSMKFEKQAERLACKWLRNEPLYNRQTW
jgi:hypothetical protein